MRISDWSSDVCSSDLGPVRAAGLALPVDDRGAAAVPVLQGHRQRPLGGFQRPVGLQRVGHGQAVGGVPVVAAKIGRAHVCTPVTNAQIVCRLLLEKNKRTRTCMPVCSTEELKTNLTTHIRITYTERYMK